MNAALIRRRKPVDETPQAVARPPQSDIAFGLLIEPSTGRSRVVAVEPLTPGEWLIALNPGRRGYAIVFGSDLVLATADGRTPVYICTPSDHELVQHHELKHQLIHEGFSQPPGEDLVVFKIATTYTETDETAPRDAVASSSPLRRTTP